MRRLARSTTSMLSSNAMRSISDPVLPRRRELDSSAIVVSIAGTMYSLITTDREPKTSSELEVKRNMPAAGIAREKADRPLSAGQVAARSGVAVSTVHFYEAKGLIKAWRSSGNQRRYSRDILRRVAIIKVAQRLGLPLSMIKQAIDSLPGGRTPTAKDWKR